MSILMFLIRSALSLNSKMFGAEKTVLSALNGRSYPKDSPITSSLLATCAVHDFVLDGQTVITLTPRKGRTNNHILYLHGGGYVFPLMKPHWWIINALIQNTGASVTVPLYALAPENDHVRATRLVDDVFDSLKKNHPEEKIIIAGDSAGGNFAVNLSTRRRDSNRSMPDKLILFSPWLDLALQDECAARLEPLDVMLGVSGLRLCGRWWAGGLDPESAQLSPLYANLKGLPPLAIFQGDRDIFVIDARTFEKKCADAGVECEYFEYPGAFHVFMGATFTAEARDVYQRVRNFLKAEIP